MNAKMWIVRSVDLKSHNKKSYDSNLLLYIGRPLRK